MPTERRPTPKRRAEPLATRLRVTLMRTSRRLREQRVADVSDTQLAVLGVLLANGPLTPSDLAERERVRPPTMTRTMQPLLEAGLVERQPHPNDGRQVLISVTEAGRERVLATRRRRDEWLQRRLASLSTAERATLSDAEQILRRIHTQ